MRRKCCVPNCDFGAKCTICRVVFSFFKTPRDPSMIKKWELALGLKAQSLRSHDRICSLHFRKGDIVTKRFITLKRPTRNSKIVLEMSKLNRHAVPTIFPFDNKQCNHRRGRFRSTIKCNAKPGRTENGVDEDDVEGDVEEEEEDDDDDEDDSSSADDGRRQQRRSEKKQDRAESVGKPSSSRGHIRALSNLRDKWLEDKKVLVKEIRLLEAKIADLDGDKNKPAAAAAGDSTDDE